MTTNQNPPALSDAIMALRPWIGVEWDAVPVTLRKQLNIENGCEFDILLRETIAAALEQARGGSAGLLYCTPPRKSLGSMDTGCDLMNSLRDWLWGQRDYGDPDLFTCYAVISEMDAIVAAERAKRPAASAGEGATS